MSKVSFTNLKLKMNNEVKTFEFNDHTIEVKQYLNSNDKYDLIMVTLQKSEEDGIYNSFKLDLFFALNLVYMYTNLSFTEKQKEDEVKLYDLLKSSNFIDMMLDCIPEDEYNELLNAIETIAKEKMKYSTTAGAVIQKIISDLPKNAQAAMEIVNSFDKEKYKEVLSFAESVNNGKFFA